MSRLCPRCGDAKDFYITDSYKVECGYCGYTVAKIEAQFVEASRAAKEERRLSVAKRANDKKVT